MVTVVPLTVQGPVEVIVAATPAFVVAVTLNVDWYGALVGAPVKLTVGGIAAATVVVSVTCAAAA
jgi:hypothetical protein